MQWAATWLYKATMNQTYYQYIDATVSEFNWDLKYAASQILLTEVSAHFEYNGLLICKHYTTAEQLTL